MQTASGDGASGMPRRSERARRGIPAPIRRLSQATQERGQQPVTSFGVPARSSKRGVRRRCSTSRSRPSLPGSSRGLQGHVLRQPQQSDRMPKRNVHASRHTSLLREAEEHSGWSWWPLGAEPRACECRPSRALPETSRPATSSGLCPKRHLGSGAPLSSWQGAAVTLAGGRGVLRLLLLVCPPRRTCSAAREAVLAPLRAPEAAVGDTMRGAEAQMLEECATTPGLPRHSHAQRIQGFRRRLRGGP